MRLSKTERENIDRFGCTFKPGSTTLYVAWPKSRMKQVADCEIETRFLYRPLENVPLLSLAFEIAPVRFLPIYCYFPFDLGQKAHERFLLGLLAKRGIDFVFFSGSQKRRRKHRYTALRISRIRAFIEDVQKKAKELDCRNRDLDKALLQLEGFAPLPYEFASLLSRKQMKLVREQAAAAALNQPQEERERAQAIVQSLANIPEEDLPSLIPAMQKSLQTYRNWLFFLHDLFRDFSGNEGIQLKQSLADMLVSGTSVEEMEEFAQFTVTFRNALNLIDRVMAASEQHREQLAPELSKAASDVLKNIPLALSAVKRITTLAGIAVGGRAGRKPVDYSKESELRKKSITWSLIAKHALENRSDLREEFRGKQFQELDYRQKTNLIRRIQAGVASYEKRVSGSQELLLLSTFPKKLDG